MRLRRRPGPDSIGAGVALRGPLWVQPGEEYDAGLVVVGDDGRIVSVGPDTGGELPFGVRTVDAAWIGPGLVDAHVHLAFADPLDVLRHGVVKVRDLGAPPRDAVGFRALAAPLVEVAGPLLTAPGGYPSRTWGRAGFAGFVDDGEQATRLVTGLAQQVDVIKLALEPAGGPVPTPEVTAAVVDAAHAAGRPVTAHALTVGMVERALDAGVDELAHTPTQRLPDELVARIVADGVRVVSTLVTSSADGPAALANARALASAGAQLRYGTDLGNVATRPGADPRELLLLAEEVGLGAEATLAAATEPITPGAVAAVVALDADPRTNPRAWRRPRMVVVGATLLAAAE